MKNLLAAIDIQLAPEGGFKGFGKLGFQGDSLVTNAAFTFTDFISSIIGVMTIVAIIWFIFLLITGAISYMSAGGDKQAIETAKKKIANAVVGLVIVIISVFIVKLVGYILGIPNLLNFANLFQIITGNIVR